MIPFTINIPKKNIKLKKTILFCLALVYLIFYNSDNKAQTYNYKAIFNTDYQDAIQLMSTLSQNIDKISLQYKIDSKLVKAIVFPELIRFSMFKDFFETKALELIYIDNGASYADFSIGIFQIKPSFIEKLEQEITKNKLKNYHFIVQQNKNERTNRIKRINNLKSIDWQIKYIVVLCKYLDFKFHENHLFETKEKIKIYATAYNSDFLLPYNQLEKKSKHKYFPYGTKYKGEQYSYSDICIYFYNNHLNSH